jgi:site-specific DNA-methyltransferase (adenine-specific)/site-specific DNA-methyltransferase (cytosine-N4-specific)
VTLFDPAELPGPTHRTEGLLIVGDAQQVLSTLPDQDFQCVVTSPPYWGLRDYGIEGQIGAESEIDGYIDTLVKVFSEVRRTLRDDGTFWLNVGDSFTSGGRTWRQADSKLPARGMNYRPKTPRGLKPKDLIGVPWKLAFALQADGWYLRTDVVWHKPNSNPESVKDRPTRSHEFLFLLTKSEKYLYDHAATRIPDDRGTGVKALRSVWSINTEPFPEAHFAVFPPALIRPCVIAGSREGDRVLDPFFGSGTVGQVCVELGRDFTGIELSQDYAEVALKRLAERAGGFVPKVTKFQS